MLDTLIDVMDSKGDKTGEVLSFLEVHKKGLWHSTAHVWIYNSKEEVLFQKRSEKALVCPGYWDISAAGHVDSGEDPIEAAKRELEEELGIKKEKIDFKKEFVNKVSKKIVDRGWINSEFQYVYSINLDLDLKELELQESEVERVKYVGLKDLEEEIKDEKKYLPHGEYYYKIIEAIKIRLLSK